MQRLRPANEGEIRAEVSRLAHGSTDLRCAHRLHAVLLVSVGHSCGQVASWFGDTGRSVERWVRAYESQGIQGLRDQPRAGRPARLTPAQQAQLALDLEAGPSRNGFKQKVWSGKLLALHLERKFGVSLSPRHCQRMLEQRSH